MTNLAVLWEQPDYRRFCERLGSFTRLILFDKRGMGLSERVQIGTLEERMDDVRAVLDAVGSEQAALLGVSEGGPMSILFAATYPERARALMLCGAEVRRRRRMTGRGANRREKNSRSAMRSTGRERWGKGHRSTTSSRAREDDDEMSRGRAPTDAVRKPARRPIAFMRMAFEIDVRTVVPAGQDAHTDLHRDR